MARFQLVVLSVFAGAVSTAADGFAPLSASISLASEGALTGVVMKYTLSNPSASARHALIWDTPLEEQLFSSPFTITTEVKWRYNGPIAKRHFMVPLADIVTIEGGSSVSVNVNFTHYYAFLSSGSVAVQAAHPFYEVTASQHQEAETGLLSVLDLPKRWMRSNVLQVRVEGTGVWPRPARTNFTVPVSSLFTMPEVTLMDATRCSAGQLQAVSVTPGYAKAMGKQALKELMVGEQNNFLRWFGTEDVKADVLANFKRINRRLADSSYGLTCQCQLPSAFAYVYPTDSEHVIHLCGAFFASHQPEFYGRDSRPGTFIHELSHFDDVGDTDDLEYGMEACERLARVDPKVTVHNADNHEYYSENVNDMSAGPEDEPTCDLKPVARCLLFCNGITHGPSTCHSHSCICKPGYCTAPDGWNCVPKGSRAARLPSTREKPVGTCLSRIFNRFHITTWCWKAHGPTWCIDGKCVCQSGYSNTDGYHCTEKELDDVPEGNYTNTSNFTEEEVHGSDDVPINFAVPEDVLLIPGGVVVAALVTMLSVASASCFCVQKVVQAPLLG